MSSKSLEQEIRDLRVVLDITRVLGTELSLDRLLNLILRETTRIMEADRSSLFICDREAGELWIKIAEGISAREIRVPVDDRSIAGSVALNKRLMNIPDAYASPLFNRDVDRRTGYHTRSILCCPLLNFKEDVVGVIQVLNKNDGRPFTAYDEDLLQALSASAALAIERAMLIETHLAQERLKQEMRLAHEIQMKLLPAVIPDHPAIEVAGFSAACDETGGDYYDVFELEAGRLGIVIGDISGHGIGAALLMATARAFLRALLVGRTDFPAVFRVLNNMLERDMDASRFMTMFLGVMDPDRTFTYVSAGHEPPLVYHAAAGTFTGLDSTGMVLGMMEDMDYEYGNPPQLAAGDILVMYTDGVFEAMNEAGEEYGQDRVKAIVSAQAAAGPQAITDAVVNGVTAFCGQAPRRDDITLVVGKVR